LKKIRFESYKNHVRWCVWDGNKILLSRYHSSWPSGPLSHVLSYTPDW